MATYYSDLWRLAKPSYEAGDHSLAFTVRPNGATAFATGDVIKLVNLPAGVLITRVVTDVPVDLASTIGSSPLVLGSTTVSADLALGAEGSATIALASTNTVSAADADLKFTLGTVSSGTTTAGRKIRLVVGFSVFKDNTVVYDWNGLASERIDGVRYSDSESTAG